MEGSVQGSGTWLAAWLVVSFIILGRGYLDNMVITVPHYSLLHEIVQVIFILLERLTAHDEKETLLPQ